MHARTDLRDALRERVLALVEPGHLDLLPRQFRVHLPRRDVALHGCVVAGVLCEQVEPFLVPMLVQQVGLHVEEVLYLQPQQQFLV